MAAPIPIVDLFSGPGGLGEGFMSCRQADGSPAFRTAISIECDRAAHRTLRLRAFLRQFDEFPPLYYSWLAGRVESPDWAGLYPREWRAAEQEAVCARLGDADTAELLDARIRKLRRQADDRTVLIGGPPCQAYSLAGRSRNAGISSYRARDDERHFLYREYCGVLHELSPAVFVMENVKGMLSSSVEGQAIFDRVLTDLEAAGPGYELIAMAGENSSLGFPQPRDFVIKAEEHLVPQKRHRVFVVGIRNDIRLKELPVLKILDRDVSVADMIGGLPKLRSGLSRADGPSEWKTAMADALDLTRKSAGKYPGAHVDAFLDELELVEGLLQKTALKGRATHSKGRRPGKLPKALLAFMDDPKLDGISGHETRGHMAPDLARYLYAACFATCEGISPRAHQFPETLAPNHRNWNSGSFNDRFRVQISDDPSSTITSHISKDGHYFIHPDPSQCRSLTVREAARLQTFPDNYHFMGNRTEQFVQVGNAVPPFLAQQIAKALLPILEGC